MEYSRPNGERSSTSRDHWQGTDKEIKTKPPVALRKNRNIIRDANASTSIPACFEGRN
jgi:hypothetical protein